VWRNLLVASAAAMLTALTFDYPLYPQLWGGWPLAAALLLVWGLWSAALDYVQRPRISLAICFGFIAGGIVLTHGSEIYTGVIGLLFLLVASWRRLAWGRLVWHLPLAGAVAAAFAAPYLPSLVGWAGSGGAVSAGYHSLESGAIVGGASLLGGATFAGVPESTWMLWTSTFGAGLEIDFPLRLMLVACGVAVAFRSGRGRVLVPLLLTFFLLGEILRTHTAPLTTQIYATTFPWGMDYRLATVEVVAAALLGGAGAVALRDWVVRQRSWWWLVRVARGAAVVSVLLVTAGLATLLPLVAAADNSYTADDAAAMGWLRLHVQPGQLVANDGSSDGGVWAPYKAGVAIVAPRSGSLASSALLRSLGQLDGDLDAQAFACTQHIRYLYHGAKQTAWEPQRVLPELDDLRRSAMLTEVFSSGQAVVFELNVPCG
jgi:hypothetical protein